MTLITATAIKEAEDSKLGIAFTRAGIESPLIVKLVREGGLFESTELRAGMIVGDIQGIPMTWKTPKDAADLLRSAPAGEVTITSPVFVGEITKESADVKLGIALKNSTKAAGIFISKVAEDGAFGGTELAPGQKVLSINGTPCPATTSEAIALVKEAVGTLKIVTIPTDLTPSEEEEPVVPQVDAPEAVKDAAPESAPIVEEKKEDMPEEEEPLDSKPKEMQTVEPDAEEDKGIIDKIFATCIC